MAAAPPESLAPTAEHRHVYTRAADAPSVWRAFERVMVLPFVGFANQALSFRWAHGSMSSAIADGMSIARAGTQNDRLGRGLPNGAY